MVEAKEWLVTHVDDVRYILTWRQIQITLGISEICALGVGTYIQMYSYLKPLH